MRASVTYHSKIAVQAFIAHYSHNSHDALSSQSFCCAGAFRSASSL
jgi:hypothetical protein